MRGEILDSPLKKVIIFRFAREGGSPGFET
jgi:hypothetical protein